MTHTIPAPILNTHSSIFQHHNKMKYLRLRLTYEVTQLAERHLFGVRQDIPKLTFVLIDAVIVTNIIVKFK